MFAIVFAIVAAGFAGAVNAVRCMRFYSNVFWTRVYTAMFLAPTGLVVYSLLNGEGGAGWCIMFLHGALVLGFVIAVCEEECPWRSTYHRATVFCSRRSSDGGWEMLDPCREWNDCRASILKPSYILLLLYVIAGISAVCVAAVNYRG